MASGEERSGAVEDPWVPVGLGPMESLEEYGEVFAAAEDEEVDPRIEGLLDQLNSAISEINRLENEFYLSKKRLNQGKDEATTAMTQLYKRNKKQIERSRPYYEFCNQLDAARTINENEARTYERSCREYEAAREAATAAEREIMSGGQLDDVSLDTLNHATTLVQETYQDKIQGEQRHNKSNASIEAMELHLAKLEKQLRKDIDRARVFHVTKASIENQLKDRRKAVTSIEEGILAAKQQYKEAFCGLENVSNDIHKRRRQAHHGLTRRDSGFMDELEND